MGKDSVIVEIRAGTGGDEAALFVADLFNMYSSFAKSKDWKVRLFNVSATDLGGFKQIVFMLKGDNAYNLMKNEGGVHRVQRVPSTEKGGRIHTSTVTIAILKKVDKKEVEINPKDIKIETYKASGPGGQYVNKRETAVRITHLPTKAVAESQSERSQGANKENALEVLRAKVAEHVKEEKDKKRQADRQSQIGSGKRAEKIRTYNFPQNRLTDHRIKKSWHNLENIMKGNLDQVFKKIKKFQI